MTENNSEISNLEKHNQQIQLAESIDGICSKLLRELKNTDYKSMDSFKPYISPKENISKILNFYEKYSEVLKKIEKLRIKIERSPLEGESGVAISIAIKDLDELGIIDILGEFKGALKELSEYSEVNIVKTFIKDSEEYYNKIVESIKQSFLNALNRLPKVVQNIHIYAQFLLKHVNEKELTMEYTKQVHARLGFFGIKDNFGALVSATSNLTQYFNIIIKLNTEILGKRVAHNINIGLVSLMIINLKKVIVDSLLKIEKDPKGTDIPLLVKLWGNLKHSDGPVIKELEDLFVFKDQIKKLIVNCLVQFLAQLETLDHPNKQLRVEKECEIMNDILNSFKENEMLLNEWTSKFGPSFGVYKSKDFGKNFSGKCLIKISRLSEQLEGVEKYVYSINNKQIFKDHTKKYKEMSLKASIAKDCQLIVGMWKINLESHSGLELNRFIKNELLIHQKYYLPLEQRKIVQDKLKEEVEDLIVRRIVQGQTSHFKEEIEKTYSGL